MKLSVRGFLTVCLLTIIVFLCFCLIQIKAQDCRVIHRPVVQPVVNHGTPYVAPIAVKKVHHAPAIVTQKVKAAVVDHHDQFVPVVVPAYGAQYNTGYSQQELQKLLLFQTNKRLELESQIHKLRFEALQQKLEYELEKIRIQKNAARNKRNAEYKHKNNTERCWKNGTG